MKCIEDVVDFTLAMYLETDCIASALDLVFVVDGSGSICDNDPDFVYGKDVTCNNWKFILQFMVDFVRDMEIGFSATRVGLVTFATQAELEWNLTRYKLHENYLLNLISLLHRKAYFPTLFQGSCFAKH